MLATRLAALGAAAALLAGTAASPAPAVAASAPAAEAGRGADFCNRHTYDTKVRFVKGSTSIGISRMWVHTYPGDTTIHRGETVTTDHRKTFKAKVGTTVGASIGAEAMLKKVVGIFAEIHGESSYRASFGTTKTETRTVTSETTTRIPGGKTVVWFVGHKVVTGTFEYSSCNALDGSDPDTGVVKWRKSSWDSFAIRDDGGQRCDLRANTLVAKAAKKIACDA